MTDSTPSHACGSILVPQESGFCLQDERTSISGLGDARTFILADLAAAGAAAAAAAAAAAYLMMLNEPEGAAGGEEVNNNLL